MSLAFDSKEELHLQMTELQKKLKQSEEERKKLEKACDVLVRAFREEQRRNFKALSNKYEKFLEDCNIRRKRNDIILRSLCRVEDKAKAIFAKTEQLKLLKDRYVSYLKQNDFLKAVEPQSKVNAYSSKTNVEAPPKSVHWKTPVVSDVQEYGEKENFELSEDSKLNSELLYLQTKRFENGFCTNLETSLGIDNPTIFPNKHNGFDNNLVSETTFQVQQTSQHLVSPKIQETQKREEKNDFNYLQARKESIHNLKNESNMSMVTEVAGIENFNQPEHLSNTIFKDSSYRTEDKTCSNEFDFKLAQNSKLNYVTLNNKRINSSSNTQNQSEYSVSNIKTEKNSSHGYLEKADLQSQFPNLDQVQALRERGVLKHQESIDKLKVTLEDYCGGGIDDKHEKEGFQGVKENKNNSDQKENEKIVEKDEIETSEKQENLKTLLDARESKEDIEPTSLNSALPKQSTFYDEDKDESDELYSGRDGEDNSPRELNEPKDEVIYPKGLDGVNYQNETYPESYYEQPVHSHNYSNLVSTVILEEDENELEAEQQESSDEEDIEEVLFNNQIKNVQKTSTLLSPLKMSHDSSVPLDHSFINSSFNVDFSQPSSQTSKESTEIAAKNRDLTKAADLRRSLLTDPDKTDNEDSNSEKIISDRGNKFAVTTDQSRNKNAENLGSNGNGFDKLKDPSQTTKTNLSHLLESDSESFQIEHGDVFSGNEDSDFDFSFQQNKG